MATPMVKLKPQTHARLQEISRQEDRPMGEIITYLVDRYERERFWRGAAEDVARIKANPEAWRGYQDESAEWEATLADGLDNAMDQGR